MTDPTARLAASARRRPHAACGPSTDSLPSSCAEPSPAARLDPGARGRPPGPERRGHCAGALHGLSAGEPAARCTPPRRRATPTSRSSPAPSPRELREPAARRLRPTGNEAVDAVTRGPGTRPIERTPGGRTFTAAAVRRHAAARGRDPPRRPRRRLHRRPTGRPRSRRTCSTAMAKRDRAGGPARCARHRPGRTLDVRRAADRPSTGPSADLAWWLTGRGRGDGPVQRRGDLPLDRMAMVTYTGEVTPGGARRRPRARRT